MLLMSAYVGCAPCSHGNDAVCGLQPEVGDKYAALLHPIAKLADNMTRDLDPRVRRTVLLYCVAAPPAVCASLGRLQPEGLMEQDGLQFLRMRTGKKEIMVSTCANPAMPGWICFILQGGWAFSLSCVCVADPDFTLAVIQSTLPEVKPESQGRPKQLTR